MDQRSYTAFAGSEIIIEGARADVAQAVQAHAASHPLEVVLVFNDATGDLTDLAPATVEARGAPATVATPEPPARRRGRPRLGVVAREITLLPRHWDWLAGQPGGASAALRRLVEQARKADAGATDARQAREAAYRFLSAIAGDYPGFEEASRALFAADFEAFGERMRDWPVDVAAYAMRLARRDVPPDQAASRISAPPPRPGR